MDDKFETIGKYLLPMFRSIVAKELVAAYGLTQGEVSKLLCITQAAVSQYVNSKRAISSNEKFSNIFPKIKMMASRTAEQLAQKQVTWKEVIANFCLSCFQMLDEEENKAADNYSI